MAATNATFVQSAQGISGAGGVVMSAAPTAGNLLICFASDGTTIPTLNAAWTLVGSIALNPRSAIGWRIAGSGESTSQVVASAPAATTCAIYEFKSPTGWPSNPVFNYSLQMNTAQTPATVTSASLGVVPLGGFVVAFCNSNTAGNTSPTAFTGVSGAGFTIDITNFHAASGGAVGNGMCGYVLNPTLDAGGNFTAITATWSGTTSSGATIGVLGLVTAPAAFTGNWVSSSPTGGVSTVQLPSSPVTGNILVATGITGGNTPLTTSPNWNMIPNNVGAATQSFMAWRYVGSGQSGQQTPFNTSTAIVTVIMAEFAVNSSLAALPVDVWNGLSQPGSGSPPTATSPSITPTFASDFVVLMTYLANKSSSTVTSVAGMTKVGDLVLTPGASTPGPGSMLYQLNVGTSPFSVALNFTGPSSGIGVLVAAFNPIGFSHGSLSQTIGCTISATGTVPNRAVLAHTVGCTLAATGAAQMIHASLNQTIGCTASTTIANPIGILTANFVTTTPVSGATVTLPNPPTQGNVLIAFGCSNVTLTPSAGWTLIQHYAFGAARHTMCWKFAGASEPATQTPFTGSSVYTVALAEITSATGWGVNPVDGSSIVQGAPAVPPTCTTPAITPHFATDFAFLGTYNASPANTPPTAVGAMTKLTDLVLTPGAAVEGPGSVFYQSMIGTSSYSQVVTYGGSTSAGAYAIMVALTNTPSIHCTLTPQTLSATISATGTVPNRAVLSQTVGCTVAATIANPIGFTGNFVTATPTAGSTVTLPNAPIAGNLLIATGNAVSNLTMSAGWTMINRNLLPNVRGTMAWKIAGTGESATQTPFNNPTFIISVVVAEFTSATGWPINPVDVSTAQQSSSASPPVVTTGAITPHFATDFAVLIGYQNQTTNTAPTAGSMTKLTDVSLTPGTPPAIGPSSVFYQSMIGTAPYSQTVTFGGSTAAAVGAIVVALTNTPTIHCALTPQTCPCTISARIGQGTNANLSQTIGATISATAHVTTHAALSQTIGCTLSATAKTQAGANASLSQVISCSLAATAHVTTHAALAQVIGCTLVATGKASAIHASLSQTIGATISATGILTTHAALSQTIGATLVATAVRTSHAVLAQTCPCTIVATAIGPPPRHAALAQTISCSLVATGKTTAIHASLTQTISCSIHATGTAQVIHASLAQTCPCTLVATGGQPLSADVAQVVIEGMSPPILPYELVAQVVVEGMSPYQTVPLRVTQVVIEGMSPNVYPYNPQPPEAFAPP